MLSIKRHKHRIHPCSSERKAELLKHLLTCNEASSILVVASKNVKDVQKLVENRDIIVTDDISLLEFPQLQRDVLISYDLPSDANAYLERITHAKTQALIILEPEDQDKLYPIETLLSRVLMQEVISGFEVQAPELSREERPIRKTQHKNMYEKKPYAKKGSKHLSSKRTAKRISIKAIKPKSDE